VLVYSTAVEAGGDLKYYWPPATLRNPRIRGWGWPTGYPGGARLIPVRDPPPSNRSQGSCTAP